MSMDELPPTEVFLFLFLGKFCHSQAVQFLCNFCTCEEEAELVKTVVVHCPVCAKSALLTLEVIVDWSDGGNESESYFVPCARQRSN